MHRRPLLLLVAFALAAMSAWAADPFVGTWKLNVDKSKNSSGRPSPAETQTIEATDDGYRIRSTVQEPIIMHLDGKEHAADQQGLALQIGAERARWRRLDSRNIESVFQRGAQTVATIRREISADGRTMTTSVDGIRLNGEKIHQARVFERQ